MKSRILRFNTYLMLLALVVGLGCKTAGKKDASTLRLHLEANPDPMGHTETVLIGRTDPFPVHVQKAPFLTELNIVQASVVDVMGGFQIMIQFDRQGTWLLEQYSTMAKDKHVAIFSQFGQARWLAAPVFSRRIADGLLVFTPDATHEEAERIVRGLSALAKEVKKNDL